MKRLKILFDANPLVTHKSGVGYYTYELIQAMAATAPDSIELVGHYFNFLGRRTPSNLPQGANIRYIQSSLIPGKILNICRRFGVQPYFELLTRQSADILLFPNFVSLPSLKRTPTVIVVYDLGFVDCPDYVSDANRMFLQKWVPRSTKQAELVVTISDFIKNRIMQVFSVAEGKLHITPIPPIAPAQPDRTILEKYRLPAGYLLFVGTIEPRKNILGLVNAYALLPAAVRDKTPLVLVGGPGWHDAEILARIQALQASNLRIVQTGYVSDQEKAALYESALICVQPSHYEGFGMPVLEAMSYGKPVACSDIEVMHEVAGDAAVYFDQNDSQAMADTLIEFINSKPRLSEYAKRGRQHIANFPTWDKVAADLYEKLLKLVK